MGKIIVEIEWDDDSVIEKLKFRKPTPKLIESILNGGDEHDLIPTVTVTELTQQR
jgi:hypothetical protein